MKKLFAGLALATVLFASAGCAQFQNLMSEISTSSVPAKTVVTTVQSFDAAEQVATIYIKYCTPSAAPAGCSDAAIQKIIDNMPTWRKARDDAFNWAQNNPSGVAAASLYQGVQTAASDLQSIITQYNIASVVPASSTGN